MDTEPNNLFRGLKPGTPVRVMSTGRTGHVVRYPAADYPQCAIVRFAGETGPWSAIDLAIIHPEERPDERFVGNTVGNRVPDKLSSLSTARVGKVAYAIDGGVLEEWENCFPLFIGKSDLQRYDRIMTRA